MPTTRITDAIEYLHPQIASIRTITGRDELLASSDRGR